MTANLCRGRSVRAGHRIPYRFPFIVIVSMAFTAGLIITAYIRVNEYVATVRKAEGELYVIKKSKSLIINQESQSDIVATATKSPVLHRTENNIVDFGAIKGTIGPDENHASRFTEDCRGDVSTLKAISKRIESYGIRYMYESDLVRKDGLVANIIDEVKKGQLVMGVMSDCLDIDRDRDKYEEVTGSVGGNATQETFFQIVILNCNYIVVAMVAIATVVLGYFNLILKTKIDNRNLKLTEIKTKMDLIALKMKSNNNESKI